MRSESRASSSQETAVKDLVAEIATDHRVQAALRISAHFDLPLTDREVEVFDATIHEIVQTESAPVRARVAASLAHVPSGPVRTVLFLAQDDEESVAAPILRHSPLVPEAVLVTVAWSRGLDGGSSALMLCMRAATREWSWLSSRRQGWRPASTPDSWTMSATSSSCR